MRWIVVLLLPGVLLLAAACGDDDGDRLTPTATAPVQSADTLPPPATDTPVPPEPTEPPPQQQEQPAEKKDLRVAVWDDTVDRALISGLGTQANSGKRAELWVRGFGSWFPNLEYGGDSNTLGAFPVGEEHEFFIYPDGRDGKEIRVVFRMTEEIISGSDRDMVQIGISDTTVTVFGTVIPGLEMEFGR